MIALFLKRSRRGRPHLTAGQFRGLALYLRLSEKELFLLQRRADHAGVPVSPLARDLALYGTTPVPCVRAIHRAAAGKLARVGNLLNQAMHRINAGRLAPEIRTVLEDLEAILTDLLHSLEEEPE